MRRAQLLCAITICLVLAACSSDEPTTTTTTSADPRTPAAPAPGPTRTTDSGSRFAGLGDPVGGIPVESLPIDVSAPNPRAVAPTYDPSAIPAPRYQQPAPAAPPVDPAAGRHVPPPPPPPAWPANRWTTPAGR